jgi:hypothetical protein
MYAILISLYIIIAFIYYIKKYSIREFFYNAGFIKERK